MCKFPQSKAPHVSRVMVSSEVTHVSSSPGVSPRVTSISSSSTVSRVTISPNSTPELKKRAVTMLFEVLPQHGITREVCIKGPRVSSPANHTYVTEREKTSNSRTSRMTPPATLHAKETVNAWSTSDYNDVFENNDRTARPALANLNPSQGIVKSIKTTRSEITMVANSRPVEKAERVLSERPKDHSATGDSGREGPAPLVSSALIIPEKENYHNGLHSEITVADNIQVTPKSEHILTRPASTQPRAESNAGIAEKEATTITPSSGSSIRVASIGGTPTAPHIKTMLAAKNKVTFKEGGTTSPPAAVQSPDCTNAGSSEINGGVSRPFTTNATHGRARKQHVLLLQTTAAPKNGLQETAADIMVSIDDANLQNGSHTCVFEKDGPRPSQNTFTKTKDRKSTGNAFVTKKTTVDTVSPKKSAEHILAVPAKVHSQDNGIDGTAKNDVPVYLPSPSSASKTLAKERESTGNAFVSRKTTVDTVYPKKSTEHIPAMPAKVHFQDDGIDGIAKNDVSVYLPSPSSASKNLAKERESTGNAFVSKKMTVDTVCPKKSKEHIPAVPAKVHFQDDGINGIAKNDVSVYLPSPSSASKNLERESTFNATTTKITPVVTDCPTRAVEHNSTAQEDVHSPEHASNGISKDDSSVFLPSPISASISPDSVTPKRRALKSGDSLKLVDPITRVEVKAGDQAELYCEILGSPPIAASWVKQKKQIASDPKTSVETTDTGSKLVIREVQADDSGCYSLFVRDRTGSIQHQISLSVTDRPEPPAGKPYASALLADSLTLSWSGPCYDGGSAIQCYVVEVKGVGEVKWRTLTDSCLSTSYRVKGGLEPDQEYQFRVRAVNAHGASDPGEESAVIKMSVEEDGSSTEHFEYQQVVINTTAKVSDLYIQLEKLGVGKFGQVYRLQEKATGKILAGKFYKTRLAKEKESARMEVELMNKLHHHKLAQCVAAYQTRAEMVMVLEYIAGGELFERIVDDAFEHTEPTCVTYVRQILEGVRYMHSQNIAHLDLKPENIVCVNRTGNSIKIIDFGLARMLGHGTQVKVMQGTPEFIAPEVIAFDPIGFTTDMWSIGVICYILLSGDSPFQGNNDMETLRNVTAAQWEFDEETFEEISDKAKDFISHLLKKSMRSRLTADKALEHPWLQETDQGNTKTLSKEKIKKFLARQKWQKTGKAVLALKRMSLLTNKQDNKVNSPDSPQREDIGLSPQDSEVFSLLHQQIQRPPSFSKPLKDQAEVEGSSACLQCHIEGYPDPEVIWFQNGILIQETGRYHIEYDETGNCSLIISDVTQEDSGCYSCKALNDMGEAEICAKLTVSALHAVRHR